MTLASRVVDQMHGKESLQNRDRHPLQNNAARRRMASRARLVNIRGVELWNEDIGTCAEGVTEQADRHWERCRLGRFAMFLPNRIESDERFEAVFCRLRRDGLKES